MSMKWHSPLAPYNVVQFVPGSKKDSWIKPDIRHARSFCLLPSVTSVIDIGSDSLVQHQIGRALFFAAAHPYRGGEADPETHLLPSDDVKEWQDHINEMCAKELGEFADSGKDVHAGVEKYYEGKGYPTNEGSQNIIATIAPRVKDLGVVKILPEKIIGGPEIGIVGTPDLAGFNEEGKLVWLGDIKTVQPKAFEGFKTEKSLYPKWTLQLAAYSLIMKGENLAVDQILSNRSTFECKLITHENHERARLAMRHHMISWFYRQDYLPWEVWAEKKNELLDTLTRIAEYNKGIVQK